MRALLMMAMIGVCAAPAFATDAGTLANAGLLNTTWAEDCSSPPSADNYYLLYGSKPDGSGTETQRTDGDDTRSLHNVQILSEGWLAYTYVGPGTNEYSIVTKRDGGRKKSWWSVRSGNTPLIMGGVFVTTGKEVPWFTKCK